MWTDPTRGELALMIVSLRELIDQRFDTGERATDAALTATGHRLDDLNRFRERFEKQRADFMTRDLYDARHRELVDSVTALASRLDSYIAEQSGRTSGLHTSTAMFFAIPAAISAVVSVVVALITVLS